MHENTDIAAGLLKARDLLKIDFHAFVECHTVHEAGLAPDDQAIADSYTTAIAAANAAAQQLKRLTAERDALAAQLAALHRNYRYHVNTITNWAAAMQAACIEASAEDGMDWIRNTLIGPGLLPGPTDQTAQEFFDKVMNDHDAWQVAHPIPCQDHMPQPPAAEPACQPLTDERIDAIADLVVKGMPDGIRGFTKQWGWRQFARALLNDCAGHCRAAEPTTAEPALEIRACECGAAKNGRCVMGDYGALPVGTKLYANTQMLVPASALLKALVEVFEGDDKAADALEYARAWLAVERDRRIDAEPSQEGGAA